MSMRWSYHLQEIRLNQFIGAYAWLLHRISGMVLVVYVCLHIWVLSAAIEGPAAFSARMAGFNGPLFEVLEGLVVVAAAFHLFNGLRLIAVELFGLTRLQKQLFWLAVLATLGSVAWTGWVSAARLMAHP
jgi:succinate dehydrogenase / fumarate reductase cytochrome b subunit